MLHRSLLGFRVFVKYSRLCSGDICCLQVFVESSKRALKSLKVFTQVTTNLGVYTNCGGCLLFVEVCCSVVL